jgi:hypothetical protein
VRDFPIPHFRFPIRGRLHRQAKHDPEKWMPVFGQDHAQAKSMIPKSGYRFREDRA